jgi:hypothetical protein
MNQELFALFFDCLEPKTLAYIARDLTERLEDWQHYPEDAPVEAQQQALARLVEAIRKLGNDLTVGAEPDFRQLLEQAREELQAEDWSSQRDRQERLNWLQDLE